MAPTIHIYIGRLPLVCIWRQTKRRAGQIGRARDQRENPGVFVDRTCEQQQRQQRRQCRERGTVRVSREDVAAQDHAFER
jgi:hypothetical protein